MVAAPDMDMFCQRTGFLPSGRCLCEPFVIRNPGVGCTFRSRAQRKLLRARVQAAAPGGGDSNGENRRRKPWRKKSKNSGAGKEKVTPLPEKLGVAHPLSRSTETKSEVLLETSDAFHFLQKATAASIPEQQQKQRGEGSVKSEARSSAEQGPGGEDGADGSFVDDFNPVVLGRKSR